MPARFLPNSDTGRLEALRKAKAKADAVAPAARLFGAANFATLGTLLPQLQTAMNQRGQALGVQGNATAAFHAVAQRLRMFNSHFIQSLNNAIDRGFLETGDRAYFQLDLSQANVPSLTSDADLETWAQRIIDGEATRAAASLPLVLFPSAAEVAPVLTEYQAKRAEQSERQHAYDVAQKAVESMRPAVDALIRDLWDEIEFALRHEDAASLRREARLWGVVYISRPGEPAEDDGEEDEGGGGSVPAAPGAPTLTALVDGQVHATWTAVPNVLHYNVYRQLDGTDLDYVLAGPVQSLFSTLTGFPPNEIVRVRLTAVNAAGESPPGPHAEIETIA